MSAKVVRVQLLLLRIADHAAWVILRARDGRGRRSDPWDINAAGPAALRGPHDRKRSKKKQLQLVQLVAISPMRQLLCASPCGPGHNAARSEVSRPSYWQLF